MAYLRHWTPIMEDVQVEHTRVSSTVFSMLPTSLQSRLPPPLRSVRKSVSMQTLKSNPPTTTPRTHAPSRSLSGMSAGPVTPPASLAGDPLADRMSLISADGSPPPAYPRTPPVIEESLHPMSQDAASGVHWRLAQQGLSLMSVAHDVARQPPARTDADFERKAFLDGAEYIMKSLPEDLTNAEMDRLRASMPPQLALDANGPNASFSPYGHRRTGGSGGKPPKSLLHRGVQAAVVQLFVLAHLALPYVLLFLRLAARTEREYRVSENVVSAGMGFANVLGSQGVRMTGNIYNMGDGKVGQVLTDAVAWTIEGFTGGFSEGVGEGLSIMGIKRQ